MTLALLRQDKEAQLQRVSTRRQPRGSVRSLKAASILDAAAQALTAFGAADFSIRKVAECAGLPLATVQYYFPSLDDLIEETARLVLRVSTDEIEEAIHADGKSEDRLASAIACALHQGRDPKMRNIYLEVIALATRNPLARAITSQVYDDYARLISIPIMDIDPSIDPETARNRAMVICAMIDGLMLFQLSGAMAQPQWDSVVEAVQSAALLIARDGQPSAKSEPLTQRHQSGRGDPYRPTVSSALSFDRGVS